MYPIYVLVCRFTLTLNLLVIAYRYPATRVGLQRGARFVVSIEPNSRNFNALEFLAPSKNKTSRSRYFPIKGAAGKKQQQTKMSFSRSGSSESCSDCMDTSRDDVYQETVTVNSVDNIIDGKGVRFPAGHDGWKRVAKQAQIALFKTSSHGYESEVLEGLQRSLRSGKVENVIMEYDPALLKTSKNANQALKWLFEAGMECTALEFRGMGENHTQPVFGESVTAASASRFWKFTTQFYPARTDLFCTRRPPTAPPQANDSA